MAGKHYKFEGEAKEIVHIVQVWGGMIYDERVQFSDRYLFHE